MTKKAKHYFTNKRLQIDCEKRFFFKKYQIEIDQGLSDWLLPF